MGIWVILPGISHMTVHGKRPLHMTGHGKRPVIYLVFGHRYQVYIGITAQYILYKRICSYIPGLRRVQEYITVYTRFTAVFKRLCRYILMTCTATSTATSQCREPRELPSYTVNSHHNTVKLPSYTVSSLNIPGMAMLILSISIAIHHILAYTVI
jgi:hypothetical protein